MKWAGSDGRFLLLSDMVAGVDGTVVTLGLANFFGCWIVFCRNVQFNET